jgi:hypothetical protein
MTKLERRNMSAEDELRSMAEQEGHTLIDYSASNIVNWA